MLLLAEDDFQKRLPFINLPCFREKRWQPVDLAAEAEQTLGEVPQQLDVDTTPVPNMLPTGPVVYVASYAGGVFALDAETGVQVWPNAAVTGVSELGKRGHSARWAGRNHGPSGWRRRKHWPAG